jgi:hypothetical protein
MKKICPQKTPEILTVAGSEYAYGGTYIIWTLPQARGQGVSHDHSIDVAITSLARLVAMDQVASGFNITGESDLP